MDRLRRLILSMLSPAGGRARLLILTFHQVPEDPDPLAPGLPHSTIFAQQMRWLRDYCKVLPLAEAADRHQQRALPARAAAITFDDGYADNHDVAAPILKDLGLPATFFVTGGAVDQGIMWNDLVIEGIRRASGELDLSDAGLGVFELANDEARRACIRSVIDNLKYQPLGKRFTAARSIFEQASGGEPPRLMMSRDQVASLAVQGFDIGSHTINHPILKELSADEARHEIEASRNWVTDVTGQKPATFAYPNGKPGIDFDASHEAMVRDAGYQLAVSTRWSSATAADSPYALPRCSPWERDRQGYWLRLVKTSVESYLGNTS